MTGRVVAAVTLSIALALLGAPVGGEVVAATNQAEIEVTDASVDQSTILEGESVEVTATVENEGDAEGTFTAELSVDGTVEATADVDLDADDAETVTFTHTFEDTGEYDLAVSGESAGTVTVEEPAEIVVASASLDDWTVEVGEEVRVTAGVLNTGDRRGTEMIHVEADGEYRTTEAVTLDGGESSTVTTRLTFDEPGEYSITVEDTTAGTVTVEGGEPEFEVRDATADAATVEPDETVEVTATVANDGDAEGTFTAELEVDGAVEATTEVDLDAGETDDVEFEWSTDDPGEYDLTVSGESAGTVTVEAPEPDFDVRDAWVGDESVEVGESVDVGATVANDGDGDGTFTAELEVDDTIEATRELDLDAGETDDAEFEWSADDPGEYDLAVSGAFAGTVSVDDPDPEFEVQDASLSSSTIEPGESVEVTATVANEGDAGGPFTAELRVDGEVVSTDNEGIGPGNEKTFTFEYATDEPGEYEIAINGESAGTLVVEAPEPAFEIREASVDDSTVEPGDSVEVTATVANDGDGDGTYAADLEVDGAIETTEDVEVDAGETAEVAFEWSTGDPGEYDLAVSGESAGTVTVEAPDPDFDVRDVELSTSEIVPGESIEVTATVANDGDGDGTFTAEFAVDGTVETATDVDLDPGETETVEFERTFDDPGEYDLVVSGETAGTVTVEAPDPDPEFDVRDVQVSDSSAEPGETVTTTATVANDGDGAGTFTAEFEVGDAVEATEDVDLDAGATDEVEFEWTVDGPGEYDLAVSGESAGTVTVEASEPDFDVRDVELSASEIEPGESVEVTATVANDGDGAGSFTAELEVDGAAEATTDVDLDAGETETVEFERSFEDAGEYGLAVSGESAGTLVVEAREPAFEVREASVDRSTVEVGEPVAVTATVTNDGDGAGTFTAEFEVDGAIEATEAVELDAGETAAVEFEWSADDPDEYDLAVSGESAGTVTVEADDSEDDEDSGDDQDGDDGDDSDAEDDADGSENGDADDDDGSENGDVGDGADDDDGQDEGSDDAADGSEDDDSDATDTGDGDDADDSDSTDSDDSDSTDSDDGDVSEDSPVSDGDSSTDDGGDGDADAGGGTNDATEEVEADPLEPEFAVVDATVVEPSIEAGNATTVTANVTNEGDAAGTFTAQFAVDGEVVEELTVDVDADETATVEFERGFAEPGEYDLAVEGAQAGTVTVEEPGPEVERVQTADGLAVTVVDAAGEESITVDLGLAGPSPADPAVELESVIVEDGAAVTVGEPTDDVDAPEPPIGDVLAYVDLDVPAGEEVALSFAVDEPELPGDRDLESVAVLELDDGKWVATELTRTAEGHRVAVGGSAIAIVSLAPGDAEIVDATLPADWVREGTTATVRVTVENHGDQPIERTLTVTVDDEAVATEIVELDAGERREVPVEFEAADGTVAVEGAEAGALAVGSLDDGDGRDGGSAADDSDEAGDDGLPGFGIAVALVGLLVAALVRAVGGSSGRSRR